MRESCIAHPPRAKFLVYREEYDEITDDRIAASLIAYFEFRANGKLMDGPETQDVELGSISIEDIQWQMKNLGSERHIRSRLKYLEEQGVISISGNRFSGHSYIFHIPRVQQCVDFAWEVIQIQEELRDLVKRRALHKRDVPEQLEVRMHELLARWSGQTTDGTSGQTTDGKMSGQTTAPVGTFDRNSIYKKYKEWEKEEKEEKEDLVLSQASGHAIATEPPTETWEEPEQHETQASVVEEGEKPCKPAKSGSGAKSSAAARKAKAKAKKAEQVYAQIQDLDGFESFWAWYKDKICPIRAGLRDRGPASPGKKVEAAEAWAELESLDFLGQGRDGFKDGCYLQWQHYLTTGGMDIPHACRFLYPTGGEPEWLTRLQDEGQQEQTGEGQPFIDRPPPAPIVPSLPGNAQQLPAWMNAADRRLATELVEGREVMDAMYAAVEANPYLQRRRQRSVN